MKTWWSTKVVFTAEQRWVWILWVKSNIPCPRKLWYHTSGYLSLSNLLRTSLCKNQSSWEMKIFNPLQILHAVRHSGGMHKNALFKGRSTLVAMVTTAACSRPGALIFIQKRRKKRMKYLFLYLKLNKTLQIATSTIHNDIIRLHFDLFNFPWEWMWTPQ